MYFDPLHCFSVVGGGGGECCGREGGEGVEGNALQ